MEYEWIEAPSDAQVAELGDLLARSFAFPRRRFDEMLLPRVERRTLRGLADRGRLVGACAHYDCGQFWGGERLRLAGVAFVGVAVTHRRRGVARRMMEEQLRSLAREGVPIAALYPSTQRLYRSVGYEQAGVRMPWELALAGLGGLACPCQVVPVENDAVQRLQPLARARARRTNGQLERSAGLWARLLEDHVPGEVPTLAYVLERDGVDEGYVILTQQREPRQVRFDLFVNDWVAETPAARESLLAFFGDHRSIARRVIWHGAAHDALLAQVPEQSALPREPLRWMLRIVDAGAAFTQRGYAPGASGRLELEIEDELLPEQAGRYRLEVEGGRARWREGGAGEIRCGARGLAALFSGALPARELRALGLIAGDDAALLQAELLFAGPTPWLPEIF